MTTIHHNPHGDKSTTTVEQGSTSRKRLFAGYVQGTPPTLPTCTIRRTQGWVPLNLKDIWNYRDLLYFLVLRDLKVRYSQTMMGAAWVFLQPLSTVIVFSLVFSRIARVPTDGIPFPLFAFCGLLPWHIFARTVTQAANSLVADKALVTKVYFPRIILPIAVVLSGLVDFPVVSVLLFGLMWWYGIPITAAVAFVPCYIVLLGLTTLAVGVWLSALNVLYRDVRHAVPSVLLFWMFSTPIYYGGDLVPESWRPILGMNPMAHLAEGMRHAMLGLPVTMGATTIPSLVLMGVVLVSGLFYFRNTEKNFADWV